MNVSVALTEFSNLVVNGRPAKEYRIFFHDPTLVIDRSLVGIFRLTNFGQNVWFVPHDHILRQFLRYWPRQQAVPHMRFIDQIEEDDKGLDKHSFSPYARRHVPKEKYALFSIFGHEVRFGPLHLRPTDRLLHVYDKEGGSTGYCQLKYITEVIEYIKLIHQPRGLEQFRIFHSKGNLRTDFPTDNT